MHEGRRGRVCMRRDDDLFRVKWEYHQEKGNVMTYFVRMPSNKSKSDDHDVAVAGL